MSAGKVVNDARHAAEIGGTNISGHAAVIGCKTRAECEGYWRTKSAAIEWAFARRWNSRNSSLRYGGLRGDLQHHGANVDSASHARSVCCRGKCCCRAWVGCAWREDRNGNFRWR